MNFNIFETKKKQEKIKNYILHIFQVNYFVDSTALLTILLLYSTGLKFRHIYMSTIYLK